MTETINLSGGYNLTTTFNQSLLIIAISDEWMDDAFILHLM